MPYLGVDSLKQNLSNPQRVYLWEVSFVNPIGGGDREVLTLRCQSSTIPGRSVGEIVVPFKQTGGIKYPGKLTYSHSWTCEFIEGEDGKVFDAIYAWAQQIVNDYDGVGEVDIKSDIYLKLLSTKGEETREIKLVGCYPQDRPDVAVNYGNEDVLRYTVTFSYDYWEKVS